MKRKYFLLVLVLILAIFLSGCSGAGIVPTDSDEWDIKSVINEYYLALSNLDFNKAKSYCVYGSDQYYAVCQGEALVNNLYLYCSIITINVVIEIQNVSINGNYATVSGYTTYLLTGCGYVEADDGYSKFYLQKIGNNWKLY
jgi:hypothetical protein